MKYNMKMAACTLLCSLLTILTGCTQSAKLQTQKETFFAMDTVISTVISAEDSTDVFMQTEQEILRLEAVLSATDAESEVSALNRSGSAEVGEDTAALLQAALFYSAETDGAFDITVAPLLRVWGFGTDNHHVPSDEELRQLLPFVGAEHMTLKGLSAQLDKGTQIDLGGIAKGYAADLIAQLWEENRVSSGMISLGGNVYVSGTKEDGSAWKVAVQDPRDSESYLGILELTDAYAVTSGDYQRYFEQDGIRYHHILDPENGKPARSGLCSVTIVVRRGMSPDPNGLDGTFCDAMSTALFVIGTDKAITFWRNSGCSFDFILVTDQNTVLVSSGLESCFSSAEGGAYSFEIVAETTS